MPEEALSRARAALARGDVLIAYDEATSALAESPDDLAARYLSALALARAGAAEPAGHAALDLVRRIDQRDDAPATLREDAEALVARVAKDRALASTGVERQRRLREAAEAYERVAARYGGSFSCINAATLYLLAGQADRAGALANRALELVRDVEVQSADDPARRYWACATEAEAALVLGDLDTAADVLARAAVLAHDDYASLATTRRQLRHVCAARGIDTALLDPLAPPTVLHFCGHRIDRATGSNDYPAELEARVSGAVREYLRTHRVGFGYGSLASGADIVVAEALLDAGIAVHAVLPFRAEEFVEASVAPAGPAWVARFGSCLERASSVVTSCDSSYAGFDELFGYAARIAMGHACNHATFLDTDAEQLAVWDGMPSTGPAGTSHDVEAWARTGRPTHVVAVPPPPGGSASASPRRAADSLAREIRAILFADFRGFSRLHDEHIGPFIDTAFAALARVVDEHAAGVKWTNTWGDAIVAVCTDVVTAASCALGLHDALAGIDLVSLGLPSDLALRIGAHVGPVVPVVDPVRHTSAYWGRELTRAARIEPRTPEGEVYVTDAFAALVALETDAPFATEYVGRVTTAKDFETIPMYRLRRR